MSSVKKETEDWYEEYYSLKGQNRNDILKNSGVLFQTLAFQKSVIEALRTLPISSNAKILDVGCGSGGSLKWLIDLGFMPNYLHGIDIIPSRIQEGNDRFPNITFSCGDASCMVYDSNYFDMAMESTMFIQVSDDGLSEKIASEMLRVVKPSGYIMLTDWRYSYGHPEYSALSKKRIIKLFKVGTSCKIICCKNGALIPPIGRLLSTHFSPFYFIIQACFPFLVGQITTVLQIYP